jgi:predicted amidohydrolase
VEYLFIPAAFYSPRQDHWTSLISSIALNNSMYVLAVNLFGQWDVGEVFCGRSLAADPWGVPVAQASDMGCFFQAYLDPSYPKTIRDKVGSFHNRIPSVYRIPSE